MGRMGKFDCKGLKDLQKQLEKMQDPDIFVESCAKELAQRLYRELIQNTPYITHKLQRGWTIRNIRKCNGGYEVEIINPVDYAAYVNYGHRTIKKNGYGWSRGLLFMEKTVRNIDKMSKPLLEKRLNHYLKEMLRG